LVCTIHSGDISEDQLVKGARIHHTPYEGCNFSCMFRYGHDTSNIHSVCRGMIIH
jgi:hypothetical protein